MKQHYQKNFLLYFSNFKLKDNFLHQLKFMIQIILHFYQFMKVGNHFHHSISLIRQKLQFLYFFDNKIFL